MKSPVRFKFWTDWRGVEREHGGMVGLFGLDVWWGPGAYMPGVAISVFGFGMSAMLNRAHSSDADELNYVSTICIDEPYIASGEIPIRKGGAK